MNINQLSLEVEAFFRQVDARVSSFRSTYLIGCPTGCGKCCEYPRVMASVLEFVPLAKHLWEKGMAMERYREISADMKICPFYAGPDVEVDVGRCTVYEKRGLICRTFGFMSFLKRDQGYVFSGCPVIKDVHREAISSLDQNTLHNELIVSPDTRNNFNTIEPSLAIPLMPLNRAIKRAIEVVFSSQEKPQPSSPLPRAA